MPLVFPFDPNIERAATSPPAEEDIEICEIVQRNLRSRIYDRGRYSAAREKGVHHFHSLLHELLT
jgi:phenylpropionate dioxygenase-like ring-hydroxylating dioxygenase large terminal subunit